MTNTAKQLFRIFFQTERSRSLRNRWLLKLRCSITELLRFNLSGLFYYPLSSWTVRSAFWFTSSAVLYNQQVYKWISTCGSFTSFYSNGAQSHETSQTQSPLKVHRAGLNPSKYTQYWNPGVLRNIHSWSFVHRLNRNKHVTVYIFSFWITESISWFTKHPPPPPPNNNNHKSCQLLQLFSELHLSSDPQNLRPVN